MTDTIETTAVVRREPLEVSRPMSAKDVTDQVRLVQEVMEGVMKKDHHYGTIPGCGDKPTLLKPGAEKLCMTFRLAPRFDIQQLELGNGHREYRIVCNLTNIRTGEFWGSGLGVCSTMESKYRWRGGSRKCPKCGKEAIIKGKAEYGGGWLCWDKKGGCGEKWPNGAKEIEGQSIDKIENPDIADVYNTVLKIAKKRAHVDATLTATGASDIFAQDLEDLGPGTTEEPAQVKSTTPAQNASQPPAGEQGATRQRAPRQKPADKPAAKAEPAKTAAKTVDYGRMIVVLRDSGSNASDEEINAAQIWGAQCLRVWITRIQEQKLLDTAHAMAVNDGWIMDTEELNMVGLDRIPLTDVEFKDYMARLTAFAVKSAQPYIPVAGPALEVSSPNSADPAEADPDEPRDQEWYDFIVPVPRKGQRRDEYLKNPDTIGSLFDARHESEEARRRLWGFVNHYQPTGYNGKPPSPADIKFRELLDVFAEWQEEHEDLNDANAEHQAQHG